MPSAITARPRFGQRSICLAIFAVLFLMSTTVAASSTLQCEKVWPTVSPDNELMQCVGNVSHLKDVLLTEEHRWFIVLSVLPVLLFISILICCPLVTCCRYCCSGCGSYRRRPDSGCCGGAEWDLATPEEKNAAYTPATVRNTKLAAGAVLLLGLAAGGCAMYGASTINPAYKGMFKDVNGVVAWASNEVAEIRDLLTDKDTGRLMSPLTDGVFDTATKAVNRIHDRLADGEELTKSYADRVDLGTYLIAGIPIMCTLVTVIAAVCNIRTGVLLVNSVFAYLFAQIYGIASMTLLMIALVIGILCGETQYFINDRTSPGLIAGGVLPYCTKAGLFVSLKKSVQDTIVEQSRSMCTKLNQACDNNPVSTKPFSCGSGINATACTTAAIAGGHLDSINMKTPACTRNGAPLNPCSVRACSEYCNTKMAKDTALNITKIADFAVRAEKAYDDNVKPLLDCNELAAQALKGFTSCPALTRSLRICGAAFLAFTAVFAMEMIVIWRGQKRFIPHASTQEKHLTGWDNRVV